MNTDYWICLLYKSHLNSMRLYRTNIVYSISVVPIWLLINLDGLWLEWPMKQHLKLHHMGYSNPNSTITYITPLMSCNSHTHSHTSPLHSLLWPVSHHSSICIKLEQDKSGKYYSHSNSLHSSDLST